MEGFSFVHSNLCDLCKYNRNVLLTAAVKPVDTGDVIATHICSTSKLKIWIALRADGWLAVFGEGVT